MVYVASQRILLKFCPYFHEINRCHIFQFSQHFGWGGVRWSQCSRQASNGLNMNIILRNSSPEGSCTSKTWKLFCCKIQIDYTPASLQLTRLQPISGFSSRVFKQCVKGWITKMFYLFTLLPCYLTLFGCTNSLVNDMRDKILHVNRYR